LEAKQAMGDPSPRRMRIPFGQEHSRSDIESVEGQRGLGYQPSLDGLRAVAVGLVVLLHYAGWPPGGGLGVDLFFVLSGFLITVLLLEEWRRFKSIALGRFYARRGLRLLPALAVLLAVYLVLLPFVQSESLADFAYAATYTTDIALVFGAHTGQHLSPLWSLSVEEQFYLVWPLALILLLRRSVGLRTIFGVTAAFAIGIFVTRYAFTSDEPPLDAAVWATRFDAIFVGCCLGLVYSSPLRTRLLRTASSTVVLAASLGLSAWLVVTGSEPGIATRTFAFALAGGVLVAASIAGAQTVAQRSVARFLSTPPFVFIGRISYAIYLWHLPILVWFIDAGLQAELGRVWTRVAAGAALLVVATLSYYLVEQPFLRQKWKLARVPTHDVSLHEAQRTARQAQIDPGSQAPAVSRAP
jgi:peptidoglycan/LPS O-acetylase OafA/YrhL